MDRRNFLSQGAGVLGLVLVGCGREGDSALDSGFSVIGDIQTNAGGIRGGVLPKEFIESMRPVQLAIYEGSHFHTFSVGMAEYRELLAGRVVTLTSDVASGHTHSVTIDPARRPTYDVGNVIPYDRRYGPGVLAAEMLTREQIMAAEPVVLVLDEGGHQHNLMVTTRDMLALRAGVTIELDTLVNSGHMHPMKLDPNYRP